MPPEGVHVLDPDNSIGEADVTLFSLREDGQLLGIGAIKQLGPGHAELKSMHTAAARGGAAWGARWLIISLAQPPPAAYAASALSAEQAKHSYRRDRCTRLPASSRAGPSAGTRRPRTTCS